ncbi:MAG: hypothetical protein M3131_09315 [Actinomycetota bacterium]|nr:hypothetical protein [Actinomycetota bacterium]
MADVWSRPAAAVQRDGPPHWISRPWTQRFVYPLLWAALIFFVLLVARATYVAFFRQREWNFPIDPDSGCEGIGYSCGVVGGLVMSTLPLVLGSFLFLFFRLNRLRKRYVAQASKEPLAFVETAGTRVDRIVGRDHLCSVIISDLKDEERRPHVVLGGVGLGKTAVLVKLTEQLAKNGAVPVPVRLRDAQDALDFRTLARDRFLREMEGRLLSSGEGEKVWRRLSKELQIVIVADGLEEALSEGRLERERDTLIRLAVNRAARERLPLVIASRPHNAVADMNAAILELEPLSEDAALDYIADGATPASRQRLEWITSTAEVVETPLYLQIARDLHAEGLLRRGRLDVRQLDTRGPDRVELRVRLMQTWIDALVDGHLEKDVPLEPRERLGTVEQIAALACVGLRDDRIEVAFRDFDQPLPGNASSEPLSGRQAADESSTAGVETLKRAMEERLTAGQTESVDVRLAATRAMRLALVETHGEGVRFQHSIMQAYLGSRVIHGALRDPMYRKEALQNCGREFLIALTMFSRSAVADGEFDGELCPDRLPEGDQGSPDGDDRLEAPSGEQTHLHWRAVLRDELCDIARKRSPPDAKTLDVYAAGLEIDSYDDDATHGAIPEELATRWTEIKAEDRTVEEAKLSAVARLGEAGRTIVERQRRRSPRSAAHHVRHHYNALYDIACKEDLYSIRLAAAQEIAAGRDEAFVALSERGRLFPLTGRPEDHPGAEDAPGADNSADQPPPESDRQAAEAIDTFAERECILRAWLGPLLLGSVSDSPTREAAHAIVKQWVERVGADAARENHRLLLCVEVALAQGFKHAANRRPEHPHAPAQARDALVEQAGEMLKQTRFWFSRLTLLHARCLWALSDSSTSSDGPAAVNRTGRGSNPAGMVRHWMDREDGGIEHPFVQTARTLAVQALQERAPEKYLWIDESGVATKVGSRPDRAVERERQSLWIPPSTGWSGLDDVAQKLVADILILLNLAERGARLHDRERRLRRADRHDLPPCIVEDRALLDASRTVGTVGTSMPGSHCSDHCRFELCPYPPKGTHTHRAELGEAFCRGQQARAVSRREAPWQEELNWRELKDFWKEMERRARK